MRVSRLYLICVLALILIRYGHAQDSEVFKKQQGLDNLLGEFSFFDNHMTGFMLYDLDSQMVLYEKNSHIHFIPASTTKLLTFYASLVTLKDSTHTFRYVNNGNEITVWGTGDPSWKYSKLPQPKIEEFLKPYQNIKFSDRNWKTTAIGYGWQWDDLLYTYAPERSPFPIYGNLVSFVNNNKNPRTSVPVFQSTIKRTDKPIRGIERDFWKNEFYYNPSTFNIPGAEVPFITSSEIQVQLMENVLKKQVKIGRDPLPAQHSVFKGGSLIPLWKEVLQESDNFVAEQLLLMVSDYLFQELNPERAIDHIKKTHLADMPDKPQWVDGSGLSRHNLITPRSMITLMTKIDKSLPRQQLLQLFPQGGVNGTIKNNYKAPKPYVFAKTGTLSNNHSLVGYLRTDSGKMMAFAFMNNNFINRASDVRREMEKVLAYIKENY